ncbi:hypothetical protein FWF93_00625 [Candidatus Saccharibacteria bacterium]|nr:hypothetical protein [Candidatus Saccharibacteria bacterium]
MANQITPPQSAIPEFWHGIYASTDEELAFYGQNTIEQLIKYWRRREREKAGRIKEYQSEINLLDGQTVETLREIAAQYENPEFPKIGKFEEDESWQDTELEPLDVDSCNRKSDTTSLNVCGWCKYAEGGTRRFSYNITAECALIPEELGNGSNYDGRGEFHFNTPCALKNGTDALIKTCVKYLTAKREEAKESKRRAASKVRYLLKIAKMAEKKPALSSERPYDWFNLGDKVMCFVNFDGITCEPGFVSGKVVNGYRHHNGRVSVIADEKVHSNADNKDGCGLVYGMSRPEVLHEWEYEYLKTHPEFLEVWLRAASSGSLPNFEASAFADKI